MFVKLRPQDLRWKRSHYKPNAKKPSRPEIGVPNGLSHWLNTLIYTSKEKILTIAPISSAITPRHKINVCRWRLFSNTFVVLRCYKESGRVKWNVKAVWLKRSQVAMTWPLEKASVPYLFFDPQTQRLYHGSWLIKRTSPSVPICNITIFSDLGNSVRSQKADNHVQEEAN